MTKRIRARKPRGTPYASALEARYAEHLDRRRRSGELQAWYYQPMSLVLAPGDPERGRKAATYKPDFVLIGNDESMIFVECKGYLRGDREGHLKLKSAASHSLWGRFLWVLVEPVKGGDFRETEYS